MSLCSTDGCLLKILLATDFFPPTITGSAVHVNVLAKQLHKLGHQIVVVTVAQKNSSASGREENKFKVYNINGIYQQLGFLYRDSSMRHHPPMKDMQIVKGLKSIVKEEKPDLIHTHGWIVHSAISVKKKFGLPLVHTLHDYGLICPKKSMLKDHAACRFPLTTSCVRCGVKQYGLFKAFLSYYGVNKSLEFLKYVDKFIAVSNWVRKAHEAYLGPLVGRKISVIPNFYDCEATVFSHKNYMHFREVLPEDFCLFVGNLVPEKGVDILLEAFKQLNGETCLVIIGKRHPDYDYERYSSSRVLVFPDAPSGLVHEAYSRCRFVLVPSLTPDPCPTVALEAMGYGKALIASNTGGLKDIILGGETGILVQPGVVEDLVNAIKVLLARSVEVPFQEDMKQKCSKRLNKNFNAGVLVSKIVNCYSNVLNSCFT